MLVRKVEVGNAVLAPLIPVLFHRDVVNSTSDLASPVTVSEYFT
jgi:hypothetical protein